MYVWEKSLHFGNYPLLHPDQGILKDSFNIAKEGIFPAIIWLTSLEKLIGSQGEFYHRIINAFLDTGMSIKF